MSEKWASEPGGVFTRQEAKIILLRFLGENASMSFNQDDLIGMTNLPAQLVTEALLELSAAGVVTACNADAEVENLIDEVNLPQARKLYAHLTGQMACRTCGCTNDWACEDGCWWVQADLCSSCLGER